MAARKSNLAPKQDAREIVISREFDAPRMLVWQAMTDPKHVVQWWGPRGFTDTVEKMDFRVGGVWKHVMHGPDGIDYPNKGIFREIVEPERIVFTNGGGRKGAKGVSFESTWTFESLSEGRTRVTICMVFATAEERDRVESEHKAIEGGNQTLARLGEHLVTAPVIVERVFNAPVATVWKALTDKEKMRQWSFDIKEFEPKVGFEFEMTAEKDGVKYRHLCTITEAKQNKKLAYTWRYDGYEGDSLVTIELSAEGGKTRLKLTHEGLETFPFRRFPDFAKVNFLKGWTHIIGTSLKAFVEKTPPRGHG